MNKEQTKLEAVAYVCLVGLFMLLSMVFAGCSKSDAESGGDENSSSTKGASVAKVSSATKRSAPKDTLVIKGLYMRMSGDDALAACKEITASSKDLVVVDFRNGIEVEKDEATRATEKQTYEENVKKAEGDVETFLKWSSFDNYWLYDPSSERFRTGTKFPLLLPGDYKNAMIKNNTPTIGEQLAALAGIYGYQVQWMLPAKRNAQGVKEATEPKLSTAGRFEISSDTNERYSDIHDYWRNNKNLYDQGLRELYNKGLQVAKEHKNRTFFRLVLQDVNGRPVEKTKLAEELVLGYSEFFQDLFSKQDKLEAAVKEVDAFLEWVEIDGMNGNEVKSVKKFDPSDIRTEDAKRKDEIAALAKEQEKERVAAKEIMEMKQQYSKTMNKAGTLKREMEQLVIDYKRVGSASQKTAIKEKYASKKAEWNKVITAQKEMRKKIDEREHALKNGKPTEHKQLATKKMQSKSKFLEASRERRRNGGVRMFTKPMYSLASHCKVMVEWAVLAEPVEKLEEIIETISIPTNIPKDASEFCSKLDSRLGEFSNKEKDRKRLFFEKDLIDVGSPLWFRLVLKTTNGVEVAKGEVVKNWLTARGYYPPSNKLKLPKKNLIVVAVKKEGIGEVQFLRSVARTTRDSPNLCHVWLDDQGNVKEVYFREEGITRLFNAGDISSEEFARLLVKNYPGIPSLEPSVTKEDPGRGIIQTATWTHKDAKGYQIKLFERAYFNNNGVKYTQRMLENDAEVALGLSLVDKLPLKYLDISAVKPESVRKFD